MKMFDRAPHPPTPSPKKERGSQSSANVFSCQAPPLVFRRGGWGVRHHFNTILTLLFLLANLYTHAQNLPTELADCNLAWTTQSKNSGESMPCGGGDVGLNVWVEKGEVLFYVARSGTFDENNALLKLGRVRLKLTPNPFEGQRFKQDLVLQDGYMKISGANGPLSV